MEIEEVLVMAHGRLCQWPTALEFGNHLVSAVFSPAPVMALADQAAASVEVRLC